MKHPMSVLILLFIITSCEISGFVEEDQRTLPSPKYNYTQIIQDSVKLEEMVYVPVYPQVYNNDGSRKFPLTTTVSVRNTSPTARLFVRSVDYYDSHGKLLKTYLKQPIVLEILESVEFVVPSIEQEGGVGANFMVHWVAKEKVSEPVIHAIMIGTSSQQGISFVCDGVVVDRKTY